MKINYRVPTKAMDLAQHWDRQDYQDNMLITYAASLHSTLAAIETMPPALRGNEHNFELLKAHLVGELQRITDEKGLGKFMDLEHFSGVE